MKTRSREQAAADGMKCTAARHMFSSCMQDVHHAKNVHKQTCKMHEMENMQRTWSEMHVPSFSTPAGLRPNTNVGLHIPSNRALPGIKPGDDRNRAFTGAR